MRTVNPPATIIGFLILVVPISLSTGMVPLLIGAMMAMGLFVLFRPVPREFILTALTALPIASGVFLSMLLTNGMHDASLIFIRVMVTVLTLAVLTSSKPFHELIRGLLDLKVPRFLVEMLFFTERYISIVRGEVQRALTAGKARGLRSGGSMFDRRTYRFLGSLIGTVLVNGFLRGLRVQEAMIARGYSGELRTLGRSKFDARDALFIVMMAMASSIIAFGNWGAGI